MFDKVADLNRAQTGAIILAVILFSGIAAGAAVFTASAGVSYETGSGLYVSTSVDHDLDGSNPFSGSDSVTINNVTFTASGSANVTVDNFVGTTTDLSGIDATTAEITVNPGDKFAVRIDGSVTELSFEDATRDGTAPFTYSADGSGTITATGLPQNASFAAATTGGTLLTTNTTSSTGEATIPVSSATDEEIILFKPSVPQIDNGEATPSNGDQISKRDVNLSAPISDTDFGYSEELEVTFYLDGEPVDNQTISSNTTVSSVQTVATGGDHTWKLTITDQHGNQEESRTFAFTNPSKLRIYNESKPTQLVNATTVDVTFFGGSRTTVTRSTDNGVVDFSGLPLNEEFIAQVEANGYESRTVRIPSLIKQESVYVLPQSTDSVEVRFQLSDATGTYSERSFVFIEKPITINNETNYQIIAADRFGVNGFTTRLEQGVRYEIRVQNERGTTAQLSTYTPEIAETVTLEPSAAAVQKPADQSIGYEINYNDDQQAVNIEYIDPAEKTDSLTVSVESRDGSKVLKPAQQYNELSSLSLSVPTNGSLEREYYVNITGERDGGSIDIQETVGPRQTIVTPPELPIGWQQVVATMLILLVAGIFSSLNAGVGILVTALFGGVLWFFGLMSGLASGGAVGLGIGIATLNLLRR